MTNPLYGIDTAVIWKDHDGHILYGKVLSAKYESGWIYDIDENRVPEENILRKHTTE